MKLLLFRLVAGMIIYCWFLQNSVLSFRYFTKKAPQLYFKMSGTAELILKGDWHQLSPLNLIVLYL